MASGAWKDWEGQVVDGQFPLRRFLGCGERSAVFLTQHGGSQPRNAAIKLVRVDAENPYLELSRWERAARLSHPNLVRFFQTGIFQTADAGLLYAVMEYGEENLADVLRDRSLTEGEAREMLGPVLDALAYIHGEGFVHGHIKPSNILAVADQVKISGDGICRVGESGGVRRNPSPYDPPERQNGGISPAADVWSLGMTLVEALTQRLPSDGTANQERVLLEALPAGFVDIARGCLQADPRRRVTVAEIAARVRSTSPAPGEGSAAVAHAVSRWWRYAVPATAAVGLALAAVLAGPRILHRGPSATAEAPKLAAAVTERRVEPPTGQIAEKASGEERPPGGTASPVPARSGLAPKGKGSASSGQVVHRVLPDVPRQARDTIRGTVRVSVRASVDPSGSVVGARLDSPGPSRYLAGLTLEAARRWRFQPPTSHGRGVPSEWILRFELTRKETNVRPVQVSP